MLGEGLKAHLHTYTAAYDHKYRAGIGGTARDVTNLSVILQGVTVSDK